MRDLVFLIGYLAFIPAVLASPIAASSIAVWMTLLAPYDFFFGLANGLPLYLLLLGLAAVSMVAHPTRLRIALNATICLLIAFVIQASVSTLFSISANTPWNDLSLLIKIVVLAIVVTITIINRAHIH